MVNVNAIFFSFELNLFQNNISHSIFATKDPFFTVTASNFNMLSLIYAPCFSFKYTIHYVTYCMEMLPYLSLSL